MPRTSSRANRKTEVVIPTPLSNQRPILQDQHRFKVVRAGRRFAKTRLMFIAAIMGHGPKWCTMGHGLEVERCNTACVRRLLYPGVADGAHIGWVGPDYTQTKAVWEEEVQPRFEDANLVTLHNGDYIMRVSGGGKFEIRSAVNINSMRGGKNHGVCLDEGAFWDLETGWRRVLRPTLTDYRGWAIFGSTPDVGSWFNQLVREVESGVRPPALWATWRGKSGDNPKLSQEEIAELYSEYPPGSTDAMQELDADIIDVHGTLFQDSFFQAYESADKSGMVVDGKLQLFKEVLVVVDLAAGMKQVNDPTAFMAAGVTAGLGAMPKKAGVLDIFNKRMEGPDQVDELVKFVDKWTPSLVLIEAVQYQLTMVQALRRLRPRYRIEPVYPDKDKRARAVPWAAAMARGDVFWNKHAAWYKLANAQHLKFPFGVEGSPHDDDHDETIDLGSYIAAARLAKSKPRAPVLPPTTSSQTLG